jgi:hypothetical protein
MDIGHAEGNSMNGGNDLRKPSSIWDVFESTIMKKLK